MISAHDLRFILIQKVAGEKGFQKLSVNLLTTNVHII